MVRMMRIEIWDSRAGTIETLTSYIIYVLKGGRNKVYGEPEQKDPEPRLGEHLCISWSASGPHSPATRSVFQGLE